MTLWQWLYYVSLGLLFISALVYIRYEEYDDRIVGRLSLANVCVFAGIDILVAIFNKPHQVWPVLAWVVSSFALFMLWHLYRFHLRITKQRLLATESTIH